MIYLISGITGFLGRALTQALLEQSSTTRVVGFSSGEHKVAAFRADFQDPRVDAWVGNVRDRDRMMDALGARPDVVIHAAAMKRVEECERNPDEAVKTNVLGTRNVVESARRAGVPRVIVVSSDKATSPETCYGKTKAMAEEIAIGQNAYRGTGPTRISAVRYGNILGSTGSFLHTLWAARQTGTAVNITDMDSTRFWWTVNDAARFILDVLAQMQGAEIWVPKLVSSKVTSLAKAMAPESPLVVTGTRGPEKTHEVMINETEAPFAYELPTCYVLLPKQGQWWSPSPPLGAVPVPAKFRYASSDDPLPVHYSERPCEAQPCPANN